MVCLKYMHMLLHDIYLILLLYQPSSQYSIGTITHAKNFLNARNVTSDPTNRYYDCSSLFDKVVKSYIITGGLKIEYNMLSLQPL